MAAEERTRWNETYAERVQGPYPPPDALVVAYAPKPRPDGPRRVALDLAAGMCQNAVWLAEQGYLVNALDISHVALERGRAEMAMRNLRSINFIHADLDRTRLAPAVYDVVSCFRYLNRNLFPMLREAVKPGGLVIYQTYTIRRLEKWPDSSRRFLLEPRELPTFFPGWEVLHDDEVADMARFVARRPGTGGAADQELKGQDGAHET
ncbi:MAG: class I SAM-dependent methyltransferase [Anaerolineae bacterium]|nr:class I SAM-dependent methyltransferase [Anaerolineae bacterium]